MGAPGPAPVYPPPTAGAPAYGYPPAAPRPSAGGTAARVVLIVFGSLIGIVVVCILAVTLLGTTTPSGVAPTTSPVDAGGATPSPAPWATWTAGDGSFTVQFPAMPTSGPIQASLPNSSRSEMAVDDHGDFAYAASFIDLADGYTFADPQASLDAAVDGATTNTGMTLSRREPGAFGLLPSQSFTASVTEGLSTTTMEGLAFVTETRIFILFAAYGDPAEVDFARFTQSFALT